MAKQEGGTAPIAQPTMKKYQLKANADGVAPKSVIHPIWGTNIDNNELKSNVLVASLKKEDAKRGMKFFESNIEEVNA